MSVESYFKARKIEVISMLKKGTIVQRLDILYPLKILGDDFKSILDEDFEILVSDNNFIYNVVCHLGTLNRTLALTDLNACVEYVYIIFEIADDLIHKAKLNVLDYSNWFRTYCKERDLISMITQVTCVWNDLEYYQKCYIDIFSFHFFRWYESYNI